MDPTLAASIVTVLGGGLIGVFAIYVKAAVKHRFGAVDDEDPETTHAVVKAVAEGHTQPTESVVVAMAQMLVAQNERMGQQDRDIRHYLERIGELEQWGMWAEGPPPRQIPSWAHDPRPSYQTQNREDRR